MKPLFANLAQIDSAGCDENPLYDMAISYSVFTLPAYTDLVPLTILIELDAAALLIICEYVYPCSLAAFILDKSGV